MKWNLELVKEHANKFRYTVVSDSFVSSKEYIEISCPRGHTYQVKWYAFYHSNRRCKTCHLEDKPLRQFKKMQAEAKESGYTLPDQEYVDVRTPISLICQNGHNIKMRWIGFKKGQRCAYCAGNAKYTLEDIQLKAKAHGYKVLSTEYINSHTDLTWECNKGHTYEAPYNRFRVHKCPHCFGSKKHELKDLKKAASEKGYTLLATTYQNGRTKMPWQCPEGHLYEATWSDFQGNHKCPVCGNAAPNNLEDLKIEASTYGYKILSNKYTNNKNKLLFECDHGHKFDMRWNDFKTGYRCWQCFHDRTIPNQAEKEFERFIKGLGFEVSMLDRSILPWRKELDIYVPNKKFAIEYCGMYFHTEDKVHRHEHSDKLRMCQNLGITLLTIYESEWVQKKEIIKGIIKSKLGCNQTIYARNCEVRQISYGVEEFLNSNHLQGFTRGKFFGLFHNNELLQVMGFSKHHRQNVASSTMVLNRFCTKIGFNVVGGASKILKYAIKDLDMLNNRIITFADLRWSNGSFYESIGFKVDRVYPPDYSYTKGRQDNYSKQSLKKTESERLTGKTELELRLDQGYKRIWDCGKIRYIWKGSSS